MSTNPQNTSPTEEPALRLKKWFENFIDDIKVDKFLIETNVASEPKKRLYTAMSNGDEKFMNSTARTASSMFFIRNLLDVYFDELNERKRMPNTLALSLSDSKILVWAVIEDGDFDTEKALLLSEAKANSKYFSDGFYITSTIIEKSDSLPIPTDYQQVSFEA